MGGQFRPSKYMWEDGSLTSYNMINGILFESQAKDLNLRIKNMPSLIIGVKISLILARSKHIIFLEWV